EVTVVYRRSRAEMPAIPSEIEDMEHEGIKLHILANPVKVLSQDGKLTGVECIRMELGEPDASGRRRPVPVKDSEFTLDIDCLIIATGQSVDKTSLSEKLAYTNSNTLKIDPVTLETNIKGVFAGGDVVRPADAITAIAAGKEAAISIDRYLKGADLKQGRPEVRQKVKDIAKKDVLKKVRATMPALEPAARVSSFVEVETGFDETTAVSEAARCLNCGICSECLECLKACEAKAVDHQLTDEVIEVNPGAIIVATGFDLYDPTKLPEYGYARISNVITAMEFERLTSASGPTAGELKRASDGKIPTTIAFIQCVGSRDFKNKSYCSSVCCMHATKETILANEHHPETRSYIFCMDMRAVGKRFQEYVARAKQEYNVTYIRGRPGKIDVNPQNQNPIVWYEDTITGETKHQEVDLVVLCQALVPTASVKELAAKLGIGLDEHGFARLPDGLARPVDTDKAGIFFCGYAHSPRDIPDSVVQASAAAARAAEVLGGNS
ncbi:MAG: FAD-dependent oxidoreductase, partial [Dehalococcoidales bacterium]